MTDSIPPPERKLWYEKVGRRLRTVRKDRGLSLKAAANLVSKAMGRQVHFTTIGKLETGKIETTVSWMKAFSEAYNLHAGELLDAAYTTGVPQSVELLSLDAIEKWDLTSARVIGRAVSPSSSPDEIAIYMTQKDFSNCAKTFLPEGYIIFDQSRRDLVDFGIYIVRIDGKTLPLRFYQLDMTLSGVSWGIGDASEYFSLKIGSQPFEILGRVTFMGCRFDD